VSDLRGSGGEGSTCLSLQQQQQVWTMGLSKFQFNAQSQLRMYATHDKFDMGNFGLTDKTIMNIGKSKRCTLHG
jgi:hypothetical protein